MSSAQNFGLNNLKKINLRFYNNKCNDLNVCNRNT